MEQIKDFFQKFCSKTSLFSYLPNCYTLIAATAVKPLTTHLINVHCYFFYFYFIVTFFFLCDFRDVVISVSFGLSSFVDGISSAIVTSLTIGKSFAILVVESTATIINIHHTALTTNLYQTGDLLCHNSVNFFLIIMQCLSSYMLWYTNICCEMSG